MTIVTRNSLTLSNVNDGTITHTAYAYSADGTDSFTTVYPNLNLLTNSRLQSGNITPFTPLNSAVLTINSNVKGLNVSCSGGTIGYQQGISQAGMPVSAGNQYTISVKVINTGTVAIDKFILQFGFYDSSRTGQWYSKTFSIPADGKAYSLSFTYIAPANTTDMRYYCLDIATLANVTHTFTIYDMKAEPGSTATPPMPSATEVTNADWPSYIGQYSDFTSTASTDPAKYAPWTVFKGKDGATGPQGPQGLKGDPGATGIPGQAGADGKTSYLHIAYATNSTGTAGFDVSNATGKTYIGQYTDFTSADSTDPSKYTWSLIKGDKGDKGDQGDQGPAGSNGDPGKVVSDTEPTTRFKGLTWKYSGTADLTASDGMVISSGTEYYWSGTNWILNSINAHNINVDDLSAISTTLTNGKFISNWSSSNATGTTTIEKNHLIINSANASLNTNNTIALDNEQGMMMTYTDTTNNRTVSAGVNFQGLFVTDSTGPYVSVTPTGIVNSVDVSWTTIGSYGAYRRDGKVVTIRVVGAKTSATGDIYIGKIPLKDCPTASVMGAALAWSASVANDRHVQINGLNQQNSGSVTILSAAANQEYTFQFTYQI